MSIKEDAEDEDAEEDEEAEREKDYPSDWEDTEYNGKLEPMSTSDLNPYIPLGVVPTTNFSPSSNDTVNAGSPQTGRMISFPNWIQVCATSYFRENHSS